MAEHVWYCRVCGLAAPDYEAAVGKGNRRNSLGRRKGVVALPCGHEQPPPGGLGVRTENEQRTHRIATSASPTGTRAYLNALANHNDRRHREVQR